MTNDLARLAEAFFDLKVELDPLSASLLGVDRAADRLPDLSAETHAAAAVEPRSLQRDVLALDEKPIGDQERVTRGVLLHELATAACSRSRSPAAPQPSTSHA